MVEKLNIAKTVHPTDPLSINSWMREFRVGCNYVKAASCNATDIMHQQESKNSNYSRLLKRSLQKFSLA